jgi:putative ABC transport system substrate-binding protein
MAFLVKDWDHRALLIAGVIGLLSAALVRAEDAILVLKSRDLPQYSEAVNGFLQQWTQSSSALPARQGVLKNPTDDAKTVFGGDARPVAVVAVGTDAAKWAIKNAGCPAVFCMVANARSSLIANVSPADLARVIGVSLDIPATTQLQTLSVYLPNVKRVGVIYDPRKSGAAVQELERAAAAMGLQLLKEAVTSESSLPEATDRIAGQIDVLWAPVDSTVYNSRNAQFILTQMLEHRVPVMGFSENMVKAGALLALQVDYQAVGAQTAALLQAVLKGEAVAGGIVQMPRSYNVMLNGRVQQFLGNPIPRSAMQQASFINEKD